MELDVVGPYRVLETVAFDRLTVTVRASRGRERPVLLKLAKPGLTNVESAARALEREVELLSVLRHPAWPTLVEVLRDGAAPTLVLVDRAGHRLDAVLARSSRLAPVAAMAIGVQVAGGLAALHRARGAHGTLRPGMVELTPQGGVCLHAPVATSDLPSAFDAPEHLSPEQIVGEAPDVRSDVFLFGGLLYRMLTGRGPFDGEREGVSQRIRHAAPAPLPRRDAGISRELAAIVRSCLEKRRHDRFGDLPTIAARLTRELRRATSLPEDILIARALAEAGLGEPLAGPLAEDAGRGTAWRGPSKRGRVGALLALGLAAGSALVVRYGSEDAPGIGPGGPRGIVDEPGHLRVLARPWAEVHIDGKRIDVTPVGYPIDVTPGTHVVIFRHPAAPDEVRKVELIAGETVLVDVEMSVVFPPKPEGSAASRPAASANASPGRPR